MRKILVFLLLILLGVVFFFPAIASTPLGKPYVVKILEKRLQGKVEVDTVRLSWLGPQKFHNLHFTTQEIQGQIEDFEIQAPLWHTEGAFAIKNGSIFLNNEKIDQINGEINGHHLNLTALTQEADTTGKITVKGTIASKTKFDRSEEHTS